MHPLLHWLALPQFGLSTIFVVAFVSATLLPLGSEPAVFGLIKLNPDLFWPAILVATAGNTLGGGLSWWIGLAAHKAVEKNEEHHLLHIQGWHRELAIQALGLPAVLPPPEAGKKMGHGLGGTPRSEPQVALH